MQIRLPKSAGDALMSQDAPKNGAMLFELSTSAGRSLHAGVLDFSAAQGTVGVPEHLIRNLWGLTTGDGQCHGHVIVTYKKLPKGIADALSNVAKRRIAMLQHNRLHWSANTQVRASVCLSACLPSSMAITQPIEMATSKSSAGTYVRFQPRSAGFQEEVGDGVEQVLQASMFTHSTLTQGEWVQVSYAGTLHDLKVLALKPEPAVSIIGEHQTYLACHPSTSRND